MSFLQPFILAALPLVGLPILIHLINQWRYQTKPWGAMQFLLAANRMNRGFARIRQWLILAMRTLAVAGLIFAVARPLASGILGFAGGTKTDTTVLIMDRSPSMSEQGLGGESKLETARRQIAGTLSKLSSNHWVCIDSATGQAASFDSWEAMLDSASMLQSSTTSDLPTLLQSTLDYLTSNNSGQTEVWICSDLRSADWDADSGNWSIVRDGFKSLPQTVRFHLLSYPQVAAENISLRVTDVRQAPSSDVGAGDNSVLLSLQLTRSGPVADGDEIEVPVQIEIAGARSELMVRITGRQAELKNHRLVLSDDQSNGWGKVSLPADANNADNEHFFVFAEEPTRRVVVVTEDRTATRAVEIAAGISSSGETSTAMVDIIAPEQLDSLVLDDAALLIWQTSLPDAAAAPAIQNYLDGGGQVIFFPPTSLVSGMGRSDASFRGVSWDTWNGDSEVMVENWRGDQDLLAATASGVGLPVGQLKIDGYATLKSDTELSKLGTLTGGAPLVARLPTERGGVYFVATSADPKLSNLAEAGVVLFVAIQRAIERGQDALGNTTMRVAGPSEDAIDSWRQLAGPSGVLSTEYPMQGGVYQSDDRLFAVNRSVAEDRQDVLTDQQLETLFAGLSVSRVDDAAGNLSGIVREIWRLFLIAMIIAMLLEAALCLPRASGPRAASVVPKFN